MMLSNANALLGWKFTTFHSFSTFWMKRQEKKKYNSTVSHERRFGKLKASQANKTKDWALVQNAALVMKIKVLKLGLVR